MDAACGDEEMQNAYKIFVGKIWRDEYVLET